MQNGRRDFIKKSALTVGATAIGATALAANTETSAEVSTGGVVVGHSPKKEITYRKTKEWEEYYRKAL